MPSLPRSEEAQSVVVATVFFIAIALIILFSAYLGISRTATSMTLYDRETLSEKVDITKVQATSSDFNVTVVNEGGVQSTLVALWFLRSDGHDRLPLIDGIVLNPAENITLNSASLAGGGVPFEDCDSVRVVTERGTLAEAPIPFPPLVPVGEFPAVVLSDIVASAENQTLTFNVTSRLNEPLTIQYVMVDKIDHTGARKTAVYEVSITVGPGQSVEVGPIELDEPVLGESLKIKEGEDYLVIEVYITSDGDWYLLGKASTVAVE
ncbi:MAG: hypothetical protein ACE5OY_05000 [Candidatus Bathyarchaeia archaeon]